MEWQDRGIVLSTRRHGEGGTIIETLTAGHGRHLGLVRGGTSARRRSELQPGNTLGLTWRARLSEHLGTFSGEVEVARAAALMEEKATLAGLQSLAALAHLLPEREPALALFETLETVLGAMAQGASWPALMVRWELGLLAELGFGIDLSACAATGVSDDLAYVSPKSGRAVSRNAGMTYHNRLLPLPGFLAGRPGPVLAGDVADGFRLTGYFLERDVHGPRGLKLPDARARLLRLLDA